MLVSYIVPKAFKEWRWSWEGGHMYPLKAEKRMGRWRMPFRATSSIQMQKLSLAQAHSLTAAIFLLTHSPGQMYWAISCSLSLQSIPWWGVSETWKDQPRLKSWLCLLLVPWPWMSYLFSWSLGFLIFKMIVIELNKLKEVKYLIQGLTHRYQHLWRFQLSRFLDSLLWAPVLPSTHIHYCIQL